MFSDGRPCLDLAQQLHAVEKAISEAKKTLIHDHVDHCLEHRRQRWEGEVDGKRARRVQGDLAIPVTAPQPLPHQQPSASPAWPSDRSPSLQPLSLVPHSRFGLTRVAARSRPWVPAAVAQRDAKPAGSSNKSTVVAMDDERITLRRSSSAASGPATIARRLAVPGTVVPMPAGWPMSPSNCPARSRSCARTSATRWRGRNPRHVLESREVAEAKSEYLAAELSDDLQQDLTARDKGLSEGRAIPEQQYLQLAQRGRSEPHASRHRASEAPRPRSERSGEIAATPARRRRRLLRQPGRACADRGTRRRSARSISARPSAGTIVEPNFSSSSISATSGSIWRSPADDLPASGKARPSRSVAGDPRGGTAKVSVRQPAARQGNPHRARRGGYRQRRTGSGGPARS